MTTNQTIDGVPRELLERAAAQEKVRPRLEVRNNTCVGCGNWMPYGYQEAHEHEDGCPEEIAAKQRHWVSQLRALLDGPVCKLCNDTGKMHELGQEPGECAACFKEPAAQPQPDAVLCKFYGVTDWSGLVRELVVHVAQLQDSAKRNVKPWEDTFPPTLLPAYIERVNSENAAVQGQPAYRLLGHGEIIKDGDEVLNDDTATWDKVPMGIFIGMPYSNRAMLPVRRAKAPAPVAVAPHERSPKDYAIEHAVFTVQHQEAP